MRSGQRLTLKDREGRKVLLINPFGIGDVLFSTPLIGILKDNLPQASLYYVCNKRTHGAIEACSRLKGVFVFEKGDYKELWAKDKLRCLKEFFLFLNSIKKERFDIAIDMSMGHQYSFFLKLIGVPERVGFDYKGRGRFLTKRLKFDGFNDKPIGEYYKDLLRLIGLDVKNYPTKIWWTGDDQRRVNDFFKENRLNDGDVVIGIAPGGGVSFGKEKIAFKRWPSDKFARLCSSLMKDLDAKVVLIWGPDEESLVMNILNSVDRKPIVAPKTTVREVACLMSKCDCVVCNDSGPLHLAVSAGAKTVSIFGPSDENVYGPYLKDDRHVVVTNDLDCRPCYKKFKIPECKNIRCLEELGVDKVLSAVTGHIEELKRDVKAKTR